MQKLGDLAPNPQNPRLVSDEKLDMLKKSLEAFGSLDGFVFNRRSGQLVGGHQRQKVLPPECEVVITKEYSEPTPAGTIAEGHVLFEGESYPYRVVDWDDAKEKAGNIAANKGAGMWDFPQLSDWMIELDHVNFDLDLTMFDAKEREDLITHEGNGDGESAGSMSDKFGVPPFSVLDARQGYWQDRKRHWLALGIQSEVGRGENLLKFSDSIRKAQAGINPYENREFGAEYEGGDAWAGSGTSIFDPVLCELSYLWYSPKNGNILDPFSGGSVRGILASKLGRQYVGVDLREEQVEANRKQAEVICQDPMPVWKTGDSCNIGALASGYEADLIFSCPPYFDLELYSDNPTDLSNMDYKEFLLAYEKIIAESCKLLKNDRFACFVVGDIRDKEGIYRNFVSKTIEAFEKAGLSLYNEAILVTAVGSLPLRAGRVFQASRKLGKLHQNVLVFVKGDPWKATEACGEIEIPDLEKFLEPESGVGGSDKLDN